MNRATCAEDLVGDRIRVAVRLLLLLNRPVDLELIFAAAGLELHANPRAVRSRIREIAGEVVKHWDGA